MKLADFNNVVDSAKDCPAEVKGKNKDASLLQDNWYALH